MIKTCRINEAPNESGAQGSKTKGAESEGWEEGQLALHRHSHSHSATPAAAVAATKATKSSDCSTPAMTVAAPILKNVGIIDLLPSSRTTEDEAVQHPLRKQGLLKILESADMREPGKTVVDEFYIHLSALDQVQHDAARLSIARAAAGMSPRGEFAPNVGKYNLRTGRVSLLAYPDFFGSSFPELVAAWNFAPGSDQPTSFRRYDDSLNPPILHRKELLIPSSHPEYANWTALTATAESLGLFDDVATIGFRLNWQRLIASKGYQLIGDAFLPLANEVGAGEANHQAVDRDGVKRHLTALSRTSLSAPVQLLSRLGLLSPGKTFFDYGCGRGGDVAALISEGYDAKGWDPHYRPEAPIVPADIVNLGFVVNVIEDPAERIEALTRAFALAGTVMAVGVMLYGGEIPGKPFLDGFLTSRSTFQKYFSQGEFKDYLEHVLQKTPFMVGPGVAFVFKDSDAEQRYSAGRYRSRGVAARLLATRTVRPPVVREPKPPRVPRPPKEPRPDRILRQVRPSASELRLEAARPILDQLWATALDLGRFPEPDEVANIKDVDFHAGGLHKALRMLLEHYDQSLLETAAHTRSDDIRLLLAAQQFAKRPAYRQLEVRLQRDIKAFFGDYKAAQAAGLKLLVDAADPANILAACKEAASRGLGWLEAEHSLQVHVSMVERLPALLRAFVTCGLVLWDSLSEVQLVKIHITSGKLTLMEFDDFDETPLPLLRRRIKVQVRRLDYDVFEYGSAAYPKPVLYRKSRYLNEDYPGYAEQLAFDEALERSGVLNREEHDLPLEQLHALLESKRLSIAGMRLVRSLTLPELDSRCGTYLTYRALIECGETRLRLGIANLPLRPESYNALYDLATQLLDPVIDYFGSICLTYGFASTTLTKHIRQGIAPKLDQHAACEHNGRSRAICERGGAACDFIVDHEDMKEVANWIIENLPFDRLYFYGADRPIHLSFSPNLSREAFSLSHTRNGRLIPRPYEK